MGAIIKREVWNYMKNPILWIGFVVMVILMGQLLSPYLTLHYFKTGTELAELSVEELADADIMQGYIPASKEQQMANAYKKLKQVFIETMGYSEQEAETIIKELEEKELSAIELDQYLEEHYSYLDGYWLVEEAAFYRGTIEEANAHIKEKMKEHPYSYYFSRKFADFGGLLMGFFAMVMLAFLFIWDTKNDIYELLHTKPIPAVLYILGKIIGGFLVMFMILVVLNIIFGAACGIVGRKNGLPVRAFDIPIASLLYIVPNIMMIACIYTVISLLFKNPYPAIPLLFLYIVYSNMGSRGPDGIYGYYGRPLAIMVRFPGRFLDTTPPPLVLWNQVFLIIASIIMACFSVWLWKRRRVY